MARYVVVVPVTVASSGYQAPGRTHTKGQVVELSAAEVAAIGAGNLRAANTAHDFAGESFAVSN